MKAAMLVSEPVLNEETGEMEKAPSVWNVFLNWTREFVR